MRPLAASQPNPAVRSEQGAERRTAILAATVRLLGRDGLGAVTHRSVAREASVPLAATTYYFSSKDELLTEALRLLIADEVAMLRAQAGELGETISTPDELGVAIADALAPQFENQRRELLAKFEVYLESARRPALRAAVAEWVDTFVALAEAALRAAGADDPKASAPVLVAAIDGQLMHSLLRGLEAGIDPQLRQRICELVVTVAKC